MSRLPVKANFPYDREGSWREFNPFQICFVYPINNKAFVIKGGMNDLEEWIRENMHTSYVMYDTIWMEGKNRTFHTKIVLKGPYEAYMFHNTKKIPTTDEYGDTFAVSVVDGWYMEVRRKFQNRTVELHKPVKRPPRCFPKEFVKFCEDKRLFVKKRFRKRNTKPTVNTPRVQHTAEDFMVMSDALDALGIGED